MIELAPNISCFQAHNPSPMTLDGTNCYLVSAQDHAALIDVGPDEDAHLDAIADYLRAHRLQLEAVLLTHTHSDHTSGLDALRRRVQAPVYAYAPGYDHRLNDGDRLDLGGIELSVLHTPGHSGDCVCFHFESEGVLFAGDTILGVGTSVIAPPEGDVSQYLDSLERLRSLPLRVIAPGHGPVIHEPLSKIDEYIAHRQMRERQILAQLESGAKTVDELVQVIYRDVDPKLHGAAAWSVSAHLKRLQHDGKVAVDGERYRLS